MCLPWDQYLIEKHLWELEKPIPGGVGDWVRGHTVGTGDVGVGRGEMRKREQGEDTQREGAQRHRLRLGKGLKY